MESNKEKFSKKRQREIKKLIIEQLKKTPIVQFACEKVGISRATYYRWRKEDKDFAKSTDEAIQEGSLLVNDMAESQLLSLIRDKHPTAIIYWLKNHHPQYTEKIRVTKEECYEELKPEQIQLLEKAMKIAQQEYALPGKPTKSNGANSNKERSSTDWDHF